MGLFGSTKNDARPAHNEFGNNYSRFLFGPPDPDDPFPNATNDGQRVINARSRAAKAGVRINSGYLNPKTGILEDPDRGFGRWMGNHPGVMAAGVITAGLGGAQLMGPAALTGPAAGSTAGTVGGFSIVPTAATGAGTLAIPTAAATGGGVASGLWGTGLTLADLISGGANWFDKIYSANVASSAADKNDEAMREALAFAKQQYADLTAKEQARWDATEARRVPYRQASQDTLAEFRKLLGI